MNQQASLIRGLRRGLAGAALAVLVAALAGATFSARGAHAATPPAAAHVWQPTCNLQASPSGSTEVRPRSDKPRAGKTKGKELRGKLNLNTASVDQLRMLPGVGPAKAERVVAYRKRSGPFKRVKDLRRVKGFGYKSVKKLAPYLTVQGTSNLEVAPAS